MPFIHQNLLPSLLDTHKVLLDPKGLSFIGAIPVTPDDPRQLRLRVEIQGKWRTSPARRYVGPEGDVNEVFYGAPRGAVVLMVFSIGVDESFPPRYIVYQHPVDIFPLGLFTQVFAFCNDDDLADNEHLAASPMKAFSDLVEGEIYLRNL